MPTLSPRRRRPRLASNWRQILRRAWSVRLIVLAGALSGLEVALPYLADAKPPRWLPALSALVTAGALVARLLAQREVSDAQ